MTQRYQQLISAIEQLRPRTIVEIGTWNGDQATNMVLASLADKELKSIHYIGFDLFEGATEASDKREFNVKSHVSVKEVRAKLNALVVQSNGRFSFMLVRGNSRITIEKLDIKSLERPIMCFIDGGHSHATIKSDLKGCAGADLIIIDDYYQEDADGALPDTAIWGCNELVESLGEQGLDYHILPISDPMKGGGLVYMVSVGSKVEVQITKKVQIKTKNAVSDDAIQRNILYAQSFGLPMVEGYQIHHNRMTIVSGGVDFHKRLRQIKADRARGHYIGCVKTSHDYLIDRGIVPDFCMLLDPRAHVVDFIQTPHPDVKYLVASQVYWETTKHLVAHKANVQLYHAMVNAGEGDMLAPGSELIIGGSTSATRGISVYFHMGFRHFKLYGYDSCYFKDPGDKYRAKHPTGGKMLLTAKIRDEKWLTTAELLAQLRDFENMVKGTDIEFDVVGEGLIPFVWQSIRPDKLQWTDR